MANPMKQPDPTAQGRYIHNRGRVIVAITKLQAKLNEWDKDMENDKIDWGHVGSVSNIADNLEDLAR